ncbi:MAG: rod-binding protein [Deltaproteobacteria bacterium]
MGTDSIGGINNNMVDFSVDNAKSKIKSNEFESTLKKAYSEKDEKQLKKVCKDFEQIMLNMMFKQMKATIPKSDLTENSFAKQTFEEMYYEKITDEVAKGQGIGLADMLYKSLSKDMNSTYVRTGDKKDEKQTDMPEGK